MKIAITGHTQGIGQALYDVYSNHGHNVIGFSRSNGYDIGVVEDRKRIVEAVADCDLFINNAYAEFAQVDLLFEVWKSWHNQRRHIISVSSSITERWDTNHSDIKYRTVKCALENASEFLFNKNRWPAASIVCPTATDTARAAHLDGYKVPPAKFAEWVYNNFSQNNFRIPVLKLDRFIT